MIRDYIRPVWAEVDLTRIRHNIQVVKEQLKPQTKLMAVVKANGYGHGAVRVAKTALECGVQWIGVAIVEEGMALRQAGITCPILVLGASPVEQAPLVVANGLTATLCTWDEAVALSQAAQAIGTVAQAHVKVDTGMGRLGLLPEEVIPFLVKVRELPALRISGLFTHFATADECDRSYFQAQYRTFSRIVEEVKRQGIDIPLIHAANSAAAITAPDSEFDMVRLGAAIYGLQPAPLLKVLDLKPALSLKARVSYVHRVPEGSGISYGRRYVAARNTKIATIPVGYADGYSRLLSNKAEVLIHGKRFRISGNICMDQFMVDVGDEPVQLGDEVVLIGRQGEEEVTASELAEIMGTIHYEVVCLLSERVPRVYIE